MRLMQSRDRTAWRHGAWCATSRCIPPKDAVEILLAELIDLDRTVDEALIIEIRNDDPIRAAAILTYVIGKFEPADQVSHVAYSR